MIRTTVTLSPTDNSILSAETEAAFKSTVTLIVTLLAALYCSLPANETVIVALPSPTAVTLPSASTVTTFSSLDVKVTLPASEGLNVALIVAFSPTVNSNEVGSTLIVVLITTGSSVTVTLITLNV